MRKLHVAFFNRSFYPDTAATGQGFARGSTSSNAGAQGLTTAQFQDSQAFATLARAWNFRTVWAPPSAGYYPEFYRWSRVLTIIPDAVSRVYGDANPTLTAGYYGLRPGDTPLTQAQDPAINANIIGRLTPMKRAGTPLEVANGCLFLACDESSFMTGQTVVASGGRVMLP